MSSLNNVIKEWLEWGVEPENISFDVETERQFCADVMQSEKDWLIDSLAEGLTRNPADAAAFIEAFRVADALQMGAVLDRVIRRYVLVTCEEFWRSEFTQIHEQNSDYSGDE